MKITWSAQARGDLRAIRDFRHTTSPVRCARQIRAVSFFRKNRPPAAVGSAAILAAVSGILPETLHVQAWFMKSASSPEEDLARCQILPPRWRRSPKKKDKGIENQREESAFPASHQHPASENC